MNSYGRTVTLTNCTPCGARTRQGTGITRTHFLHTVCCFGTMRRFNKIAVLARPRAALGCTPRHASPLAVCGRIVVPSLRCTMR